MDQEQRHMPVILLLDKETSDDHGTVRAWFENSRFSTCEAADVFEALEEISDFTTATRPDVVLLDVESYEEDFQLVHDTIEPSGEMEELPIMVLSAGSEICTSDDESVYFRGSFGEVTARIDKLIPETDVSQKPASA